MHVNDIKIGKFLLLIMINKILLHYIVYLLMNRSYSDLKYNQKFVLLEHENVLLVL